MNRWKAAGIHLALSAIVAGIAVFATLGVMYPWTYFQASGALKLLTILLTVDIVIGPVLTLIVFKPGKPSLRFDLTCIALMQVAAMAYGFNVVVQARPVFLVHVGDRFHLVRASDLEPERLAAGAEERFRTLSWTGPRPVVALKPRSADRQGELLMSALSGVDLNYFPETYADYNDNVNVVLHRARSTAQLLERSAARAAPLKRFLEHSGRSPESVKFVPLHAGKAFLTVLIDAETAQILEVVAMDPWE